MAQARHSGAAYVGRHRARPPGIPLTLVRAVVRHPKIVLGFWLIAVLASLPFALQLSSVLSQQGASKEVPGSQSAAAAAAVDEAFPQHSERETMIVISAPDATTEPLRALQADLDGMLAARVADGSVLRSVSAYTAHRDAAAAFVQAQLAAAGADQPGLSAAEASARVEAALAAQTLPAGLADLVRFSAGLNPDQILSMAGDFAVRTDWADYPVPVPAGDLVAADRTAAIVTVSFPPGGPDPRIADLRASVQQLVDEQAPAGTTVNVTGEIALLQDTYALAEADNARMEYVAYAVIAVVLLLFFRAVLPAVITVVIIALAMNVSQAWLYGLGQSVHLTQFTVTIMTFVMLGAGIDYSMLLSSRYRQERLAGHPVTESVVRATMRAGESVVLAGAAVLLAFGATLVSPIDWIPPLGYGGIVGIPIILLAALTITPCVLVLMGDRFFLLGFAPLADMEQRGWLSGGLRRFVRISSWCPAAIVAFFAAVTVPLVLFIGQHSLSADPVALSPDTDARQGAELVTDKWGEAALFPTVVVGRLSADLHDGDRLTAAGSAQVAALTARIAALPGVQRVDSATSPTGDPSATDSSATDSSATDASAANSELAADFVAADGTTRLSVRLAGDPFADSTRAVADQVRSIAQNDGTTNWHTGGATLVDAEYEQALQDSFWQMIALVSAGIVILLAVALRSFMIPIRLVLTIMMSNIWAIALTVLVFQVWLGEAVINDLPIFLVILMMGLGMDYEIFLITRVREHVRGGHSDADATAAAVVDTGRVITAAGLVMAGSLGTMMLSSTLMLQQYGLGLGSAVLLDATVVRMLFVPASLLLFRRLNWWFPTLRIRRVATA